MLGLLNLNKPADWTSRDAVNRVQRLLPRKTKVGHAGTLDPLATGVLIVCVGPTTRLVPWIHEHSKSYRATFRLGVRSETDDIQGTLQEVPIPESATLDKLQALLPRFTGEIQQVPPAYSAVKVQGRRAYAVARSGKDVELTARPVVVHRIDLVSCELPEFQLEIECGTGTYIRSIGRDLAKELGTAAVMTELVRTRIGPWELSAAMNLDDLSRENIAQHLRSPLELLNFLPQVSPAAEELTRLIQGQTIALPTGMTSDPANPGRLSASADEPLPTGEGTPQSFTPAGSTESAPSWCVVDSDGKLIAIAEERQGRLAPRIVLTR